MQERAGSKFLFGTRIRAEDGQAEAKTRQCKWIATKDDERKAQICAKKVAYKGIVFGQASEICTNTCNSCAKGDAEENDPIEE